jgi:hypothetical protein
LSAAFQPASDSPVSSNVFKPLSTIIQPAPETLSAVFGVASVKVMLVTVGVEVGELRLDPAPRRVASEFAD